MQNWLHGTLLCDSISHLAVADKDTTSSIIFISIRGMTQPLIAALVLLDFSAIYGEQTAPDCIIALTLNIGHLSARLPAWRIPTAPTLLLQPMYKWPWNITNARLNIVYILYYYIIIIDLNKNKDVIIINYWCSVSLSGHNKLKMSVFTIPGCMAMVLWV